MTPDVEQAVQEIRAASNGHVVEVMPEDQGGAYVTIHDVTIGPGSTPARSWISFLIPFQYPHADIYPHFISADVRRAEDDSHGEAVTPSTWQDRPALQVSRKSNRWNPATDAAALKLAQVITWLQTPNFAAISHDRCADV